VSNEMLFCLGQFFQSARLAKRSISFAVCHPKGCFGLFVHPPDVGTVDGEEHKAMGVLLQMWFNGEAFFISGNLVFQWCSAWVRGLLGAFFSVGSVGAEFVPVIAIVASEVGDLKEGLMHYGVLEWHGML